MSASCPNAWFDHPAIGTESVEGLQLRVVTGRGFEATED